MFSVVGEIFWGFILIFVISRAGLAGSCLIGSMYMVGGGLYILLWLFRISGSSVMLV